MRGNGVYLEASSRTQELLRVKWTMKAAGFRIESTWHEDAGNTSSSPSNDHWDAKGVEQLEACDSLIVICGKDGKAAPSVAMMAGLAFARGLQVVWIGPSFGALNAFTGVRTFNTAEDYQKEVLRNISASHAERVAA